MTSQYPKWANSAVMRDYYDHHWGYQCMMNVNCLKC